MKNRAAPFLLVIIHCEMVTKLWYVTPGSSYPILSFPSLSLHLTFNNLIKLSEKKTYFMTKFSSFFSPSIFSAFFLLGQSFYVCFLVCLVLLFLKTNKRRVVLLFPFFFPFQFMSFFFFVCRLVVSQNGRALHIVFPHQFLDSPEWFGVSTDEYFQVSMSGQPFSQMKQSRKLACKWLNFPEPPRKSDLKVWKNEFSS